MKFGHIAVLFFVSNLVCAVACAEMFNNGVQLERGGPFPEIRIKNLIAPEDYKSLAPTVRAGDSFSISEIQGDILLVEFFNRSCFTCIDQVPHLNSLLDSIENGTFSSGVKILGIAVGDDEAGLRKFLNNENPRYPITSDPELEHFFTLGEPEGTPIILMLKRSDEGNWLTMDSHYGLLSASELRTRIQAIAMGGTLPDEAITVLPANLEVPPGEAENSQEHVTALFTRIIGKETNAIKVEVDYSREVFRGVDSAGKPLDLFAIVAMRHSLCDICHELLFAVAFNKAGIIKGFSPIYVTRYGNEKWGEDDAVFMENKITGVSVTSFSLRPDVDAVSGATISSTVIFDEIRKTAYLLPLLP